MTDKPTEGKIVRFYRGQAPDAAGRYLFDILNWDDLDLEEVHDYIQWLFPLKERSRFNPDAPLLDAAQIGAFQADEQLRAELLIAFKRMLRFYGFDYHQTGDQLTISPGPNWNARKQVWLNPYNHNFLRITRILTSLRLLGLPEQAAAFLAALGKLYHSPEGQPIGKETFGYWSQAVEPGSSL